MITPDLSILNQLGTPMFNSNTFANRPSAGITGRVFISTDTFAIYRDNGTSWDQLGGGGTGTVTGTGTATQVAFWSTSTDISSDSALYWDNTNKRLGIGTASPGVSLDIHGTNIIAQLNGTGTTNSQIAFQNAGTSKWQIGNIYSAGSNYFRIYDNVNAVERVKLLNDGQLSTFTTVTASGSSTGYQGIYNSNVITIPAATTFPSGGYTYAGMNDFYSQVFGGSATFQNNNTNSAYFGINRIDFSGTGTVTMTQATGTRAMAAAIFQNQYNGTASGTITHLAGAQILGNYRSAGSGTLTVTNGYGLLINNLDDYGAGFTFTNRWGIYQEGTSDVNYLAGSTGIGTNTILPSSILTLSSTSKGFRMPTLTTAQMYSISSPANGLQVYKTDGYQGKYVYIENEWLPVLDGTEMIVSYGTGGSNSVQQPFTSNTSGTGASVTNNVWASTGANLIKGIPYAFTTGTTTTGLAGITAATNSGLNITTTGAKFCFRYEIVTPTVLSDVTNTYALLLGISIGSSTPTANSIGFYYSHGTNSGAWTCFWGSLAGSSATSGVTVAVSTRYILEIEFTIGTSIKYYINGSLVLTQSSGIPTQFGTNISIATSYIFKTTGTTSVTTYQGSILYKRLI